MILTIAALAACKGSSAPPSITIGSGKADNSAGATLEVIAGQLGAKGSADGIADEARFQVPSAMAQAEGALFVVDAETRLLRRIDLGTGGVSTVASPPIPRTGDVAQLVRPGEIAGDGAGSLVVIDDQSAIRRVSLKTGAIETITQIPGGPSCATRDTLFIAATSATLYLSDQCNSVVRSFDLASATWSVLAGAPLVRGTSDGDASTARFSRLQGIALDPLGNLFVLDGSSLRRIDRGTGATTTIGGGPLRDSNSVLHLSFADAQTPVLSDGFASTVQTIDLNTGLVVPLAGTQSGNVDGDASVASFGRPAGIAGDGHGQVYVADAANNTVRVVSLATRRVSTFAGRAQQSGSADGMRTDARFRSPEGIVNDRYGNVYIADSANHSIRRIDALTGTVATLAGASGAAGSADGVGGDARFNHPGGIAADGERLYVSDTNNQTIRMVSTKTGAVSTLAGQVGTGGIVDGAGSEARFRRPKGLAVDGGRLFVADAENNVIRQIDLDSGTVSTLAGLANAGGTSDGVGGEARFFWPLGLRGDGKGTLYVADSYNRLVRKIDIATARVTTLAGAPAARAPWSADGVGADARFNYPVDVVPDNAGHLYVADLGNNSVRMLTLSTGKVTTLVGSAGQAGVRLGAANGALNWPASLTAGLDGSLLILDQRENAVLRLR